MATVQTGASLSSHSDLITSIAFSSHPLLATASLDHTVRVTSLDAATGQWDANPQDWKAHDAPVLKVAWAHPEFGVLLASGGVDGVVKLWSQEDVRAGASVAGHGGPAGSPGLTGPSTNGQAQTGAHGSAPTKRWVQRAVLTDARGTIRDVEFAPPAFGLKLAAVSSDSHLRVWECLDPISMADWSLIEDIDLGSLPLGPSTAPHSGANIGPLSHGGAGPGSLGSQGAGSESGHHSPNKSALGVAGLAGVAAFGNTGLTPSMASSSGSTGSFEGRKSGTVESDGGWALSWCKEAWWGERIAVSGGTSGVIRVSAKRISSSQLRG